MGCCGKSKNGIAFAQKVVDAKIEKEASKEKTEKVKTELIHRMVRGNLEAIFIRVE